MNTLQLSWVILGASLLSCQVLLGIGDTPVGPGELGNGGDDSGGASLVGAAKLTAGEHSGPNPVESGGRAGVGQLVGGLGGIFDGGGTSDVPTPSGQGGQGGERHTDGGSGEAGAGPVPTERVATLGVQWKQWTLKVCFSDIDAPSLPDALPRAAFRERVRYIVESTWGRVSALNLWGFDDCVSVVDANIVVNLSSTAANGVGDQDPGSTARIVTLHADTATDTEISYWFARALGFGHEYGLKTRAEPCVSDPSTPVSILAPPGCDGAIEPDRAFSAWDVMAVRRGFGNRHSGALVEIGGRCLEVHGGTNAVGSTIDSYTCFGRYDNNSWYPEPTPDGEGGALRAVIAGQSRCVELTGDPLSSNALRSQICDGQKPNQDFRLGTVQLKALGETCVRADAAEAGATLQIDGCAPSALNGWLLSGERVRLADTDLCLTVVEPLRLGVLPELAVCEDGASNQRFRLSGSEIEPFDAPEDFLCLDVLGALPTPGARIGFWNGCGWYFENNLFHASGPLLGVDGCVAALGAPASLERSVGIMPCETGAPTQQWDWYW